MLRSRKYKSGSKWVLWRWTETPSDYIRRLHVIMTPWFAICVHWINKPDAELHLHDHPVSFLSLILRGGYKELRTTDKLMYKSGPRSNHPASPVEVYTRNWYNKIKASGFDRHRIIEVKPSTVTLCFMGPKKREWGFHTEEGWVYWKDYNKAKYHASTP